MGVKPRKPTSPRPPAPSPPKPAIPELDAALVDECEDALERLLEQSGEPGESFEAYERRVLRIVHELARRKLEKKLQTVADSFAPRLAIDHNSDWHGRREDTAGAYRQHCPGTVTYHSLVGPLRVRRYTYRACSSLATLVPLELTAGLMERMTPGLARCVAIGYAHMPLRTCEELMRAGSLCPPSRSTLDRASRDLGTYAVASNAEIEPQVRANEVLPSGTSLVAIGLDRVAVPMRHGEEDAGVIGYCSDLHRRRPHPRPRSRLRGPVQWRMDYVGTVAFFDADRTLLGSRKYRVPGEANISEIVERVMSDVRHALIQRPVEPAVVQDGASELWTAIQSALRNEPQVSTWTEVLDWYHLDERLTKCLDVCVDEPEREALRAAWHAALLEKTRGARTVIRALQTHADTAGTEDAAELAMHIGYFETHRARMNYRAYRARGIPIGSGVTEGACKSVVNVRAKRSGQRWSQRGLTAALHLRAMHESDRFDGFWSFFSRRYRATSIVPLGADSVHASY
jgi:hypothetical protein